MPRIANLAVVLPAGSVPTGASTWAKLGARRVPSLVSQDLDGSGGAVHELSVCASIADVVRRRAAERQVAAIHLRIGQLRQIVPDTLVYCWSVLSTDTELDGSVLEVENVRARIRCRGCGHSDEVGDYPLFVCDACKGVDVSVEAGEEFLITAIDLVRA